MNAKRQKEETKKGRPTEYHPVNFLHFNMSCLVSFREERD